MTPILIRAFGRTGTTLLIQILNTSKNIFVPNDYPFESRFLSYFTRLSFLPVQDYGMQTESFHWDDSNINLGVCPIMAKMPYEYSNYVDTENMKSRLLQAMWHQFSSEVKHKTGNEYVYYAEKVALDIANHINNILPKTKNIFLVRDPRGELASIIAFNKKRGFNGFGWKNNDTIQTFAERMIEPRKQFFSSVSKYLNGSEKYIVLRYEDLVLTPEVELKKLASWINLALNYEYVEQNIENYQHHMTNQNTYDSARSWMQKLPLEIIGMFDELMADELKLFGYTNSGPIEINL